MAQTYQMVQLTGLLLLSVQPVTAVVVKITLWPVFSRHLVVFLDVHCHNLTVRDIKSVFAGPPHKKSLPVLLFGFCNLAV